MRAGGAHPGGAGRQAGATAHPETRQVQRNGRVVSTAQARTGKRSARNLAGRGRQIAAAAGALAGTAVVTRGRIAKPPPPQRNAEAVIPQAGRENPGSSRTSVQ